MDIHKNDDVNSADPDSAEKWVQETHAQRVGDLSETDKSGSTEMDNGTILKGIPGYFPICTLVS